MSAGTKKMFNNEVLSTDDARKGRFCDTPVAEILGQAGDEEERGI